MRMVKKWGQKFKKKEREKKWTGIVKIQSVKAILRGSNTASCLEGKQGVLVDDECSSWYNRVDNFLVSFWDGRKQFLYMDGSACMARRNNPTPECMVNGTECYDG